MKSRLRLVLVLTALLVATGFLSWPNCSYQNLSFNEILSVIRHSHASSVEAVCHDYFLTLRHIAPSPPSPSRYLTSRQISNHIDHLRTYLQCFLDQPLAEPAVPLSSELLPMFSESLPVLSRPHDWSKFSAGSGSYWLRYLSAASGKGIVITINDAHVDFAGRLLHVLRSHGTALPVQFVHLGDLSDENKRYLEDVAHGSLSIEFLDVSTCLSPGFDTIRKGFYVKFLASIFSTFEEIILMDADVVPFVDPETFFDFKGYKNSGAFFFKDRELTEKLSDSQVNFFMSMLPTQDNILQTPIDKHKYANNFFNYRSKHVMESGVVVLNRAQHLSGLIIALSLQYWYLSGRILYGDKDLFWLGQLISGNSQYEFNECSAAAIGILETNTTICSTQIAHLGPDRRLLWTNGALVNCKRNTWRTDYIKHSFVRHKFNNSMLEIRKFHTSPINITHAIIPASLDLLNGENITAVRSSFKRDDRRGCAGRFYCATSDDGGELVEFSPEDRDAYKKIIDLWFQQDEDF